MDGLFRRVIGEMSKLNEDTFIQNISKHDIIGLVETHCSEKDEFDIPGDCHFELPSENAWRTPLVVCPWS